MPSSLCRLSSLWRCLIPLGLCALASALPALSQSFDYERTREPLASYAGRWRFHPGDDPAFATPGFDDTRWTNLSSNDGWNTQGFPHLTGFGWYRFSLTLPAGAPAMHLALPEFNSGLEVYFDGKQVLQQGPQTTHQPLIYPALTDLTLPAAVDTTGHAPRTVQVALRVWHSPIWSSYVSGGPAPGSARQEVFGPAAAVTRFVARAKEHTQFANSMWLALGVVDLLAGLASLTLFLLRRAEREYLWFGVAVLMPALPLLYNFYTLGRVVRVEWIDGASLAAGIVSSLALLFFYRRLLEGRRNLLFRISVVCLLVNPAPMLLLESFGVLSVTTAGLINVLLHWPFQLYILLLLIRRSWERRPDAHLLLAPTAALFGLQIIGEVSEALADAGVHAGMDPRSWGLRVPFLVRAVDLAWILFLLAMLVILLYRFARARREEEQYAAEFESARQIQALLVPEAPEAVPGFAVEAEYRPARVVSGDFYQVLPTAGGGLLIVIGDVAGKGLPAAMLVSMLIGAIRTQAALSSDPVAMLAVLNERLLGRTNGGFSTCLAARITPAGTMEIANAGHLPPYCNGEEMPVPGALPLGLVPTPEYSAEVIRMRPGDRLTFVTDGIPEARDRQHHLLGFDATRNLSRLGATGIVDAAQRFGQEDDLTAVTVAWRPRESLRPAV